MQLSIKINQLKLHTKFNLFIFIIKEAIQLYLFSIRINFGMIRIDTTEKIKKYLSLQILVYRYVSVQGGATLQVS